MWPVGYAHTCYICCRSFLYEWSYYCHDIKPHTSAFFCIYFQAEYTTKMFQVFDFNLYLCLIKCFDLKLNTSLLSFI